MTASFNYTIPNGPFQCSYLRIYITKLIDESMLNTYQTGLSVVEIYGQPPSNYTVPLTS
jgi:hypothetical protein